MVVVQHCGVSGICAMSSQHTGDLFLAEATELERLMAGASQVVWGHRYRPVLLAGKRSLREGCFEVKRTARQGNDLKPIDIRTRGCGMRLAPQAVTTDQSLVGTTSQTSVRRREMMCIGIWQFAECIWQFAEWLLRYTVAPRRACNFKPTFALVVAV